MSRWAAGVLAVVFVVAAVAKLARRPDMSRLGLPPSTAVVVSVVELALAGMLLISPVVGGLASLAVLAGFTTFLIRNLGTDTGCGCFGSTTATTVRSKDIIRNGVLFGLAATAAFG